MLDLLIITGASRGIGKNIVNNCFNICSKMIIISSSDKLYDIKCDFCDIIPLKLDLLNYSNVYNVISEKLSTIDNVNSVGIVLCGAQLGENGGLFQTNLDDWEKTYQCNVLGNLSIIKACKKFLDNQAKLRIVFFAGGGAAFGYPEFFGYSLSKTAVVRSVENLSIEFNNLNYDASIVALAPGAVETDMLTKVAASGAFIRTKTDISEPTNFVKSFITDEFNSKQLNGMFLHVRDDVKVININNKDLFKLRRIQ